MLANAGEGNLEELVAAGDAHHFLRVERTRIHHAAVLGRVRFSEIGEIDLSWILTLSPVDVWSTLYVLLRLVYCRGFIV